MKRPALVPTRGDIEVFHWLWMLRVMLVDQIRRVRYFQPDTERLSNLHNVRQRLRRLAQAGYLVADRLAETKELVYFLGEEALDPLCRHHEIQQQRIYSYQALPETERQLYHRLLVSECAVRFHEAVRNSDTELPCLAPLAAPFYHTHAVADSGKKKAIERFVTQEDVQAQGGGRPLRVRPDLVFALSRRGASRLFFLEADRGTEAVAEIERKQLAYHHYESAVDPRQNGARLWQRYGVGLDFRVLFVTTSQSRIQSLRRRLQEKPGFKLLAFATADDLKENSPVWNDIWTTASSDNPVPLLARSSGS